ncbi:hypothetical protein K502DRAFT_159308 [Neoconidiobolus thromboides FSU 785]|nr:hypothetical protein K502DRAFT_159308 [Neoconidiobolus thromboides FSU 785]
MNYDTTQHENYDISWPINDDLIRDQNYQGSYYIPENNVSDYLTYAQISSTNVPISEHQPTKQNLREICTFFLKGSCRYGKFCRNAHAEVCNSCHNYILHPDKPDAEHTEHIRNCTPIKTFDESKDIECCICMEKVLSTKCGRFGLLNCEHPFCLSCIRQWRTNTILDNNVIRSCPICRDITYFITPSLIWVADKEEKEKIIDAYKSKLKQIPCRYFDSGRGECPFGSSCFYIHQYPDGSYQELEIRKAKNSEEETLILNQPKLNQFLNHIF